MRPGSIVFAFVAVVATAAPVAAQDLDSMPRKGTRSIAFLFGVAIPNETSMTTDVMVAANVDVYATARVSIGSDVTFSEGIITCVGLQYGGADQCPTRSTLSIGGHFSYHRVSGRFRPYAAAGLGLYRYSFEESPQSRYAGLSDSAWGPGFQFGAGIDYFIARRVTIATEMRYHIVGNVTAITFPRDATFWTICGGIKGYF